MSAKPRLLLIALLAAAVALGAYAATRPGGGADPGRSSGPAGSTGPGARPERPAEGAEGPTAALDTARGAGQPVYVLARSET